MKNAGFTGRIDTGRHRLLLNSLVFLMVNGL